jgi:multimeric flavodoxin WrbA
MSKKVLVLSASPRKGGNSDVLCDQFIKGVQEAGAQAEKIFLRDKDIHYCTGCGRCLDRSRGCSQKDDMTEVLQKMIDADVIVMSTPVYFYTMDGQMKTLIDRTCANYDAIRSKDFYFIITAAESEKSKMERTIEGFRGFTVCLEDAREKGIVWGLGAWHMGEIKSMPAMDEAYEMGKAV